jgi:two-component system, NtrC family, sensor kinase
VPIAFATWFTARRVAFATAIVAAATLTAIGTTEAVATPLHAILNGLGALGIFLVFVWVLAMLRVHMERERERLHNALEQLRHAERLNVLGVLAAGVAHELGTPINVISGSAEMLGDKQTARTILAQTDRITAIVQNLLDFARRKKPPKQPVIELDPAVSVAVELLAATARKRGAQIAFTPGAAELVVRANRQEIEQVVSNLILNSIQAMPNGGQVIVGTASDDAQRYGTITVADEGDGIAPADLPHIFDPFFTTKDVGEGTGLGLSVTYGIVNELGGTIDVATEVGRGTRFVVRIPLAA